MEVLQICPDCGNPAITVPESAVMYNLHNAAKISFPKNNKWNICSNSKCNCSYFTKGHKYTISDLIKPLWFKDGSDNVPVCYCSDLSRGEIKEAVKQGCKTIDEVQKYTNKNITGYCEQRNPLGKCCRNVFLKTISDENMDNKIFNTRNINTQVMNANDLKLIVKEKYGEIAKQSPSCCGNSTCCGELEISMIGDEYKNIEGHNPDADLGLGCGIPTQFAAIKKGDHILDLGSGAGNDCFVARAIVGETGKVTGLDFTDAMFAKAIENNKKLGFTNVEFVMGDIEEMPLPDNSFDVVVSNCVLNLVPDKNKAFAQIIRVLKPNGHFCVSDVVLKGNLPEKLRTDAEMYVGCVSGAVGIGEYLEIINKQGFKNVTIHKQKEIAVPQNILEKHLSKEESASFKSGDIGIFSITVSGYKL